MTLPEEGLFLAWWKILKTDIFGNLAKEMVETWKNTKEKYFFFSVLFFCVDVITCKTPKDFHH